jgi:hypothetical protein
MPEEFPPPQQYGAPVPAPAHGYPPANGYAQPGYPQPGYAPTGYAPAPMVAPGQYAAPSGPVGKIRPTGIAILLCIVTLGIYALYYYFATHDEMKRHTGQGLGGGLALVIAIIFGIASPFLLSSEVGGLYERSGRAKPVSGATGLWYLLGWVIIVGPIVWFVKTNGALNAYWRSLGAR